MCSADIFLGLLAILFPPLPVWVKCGVCSADSLINILLCCLGYIPGLFHAWYIIAKFPEPAYEYEVLPQDREGGRVAYVYVQRPTRDSDACHHHQPHRQDSLNYGTHHATKPQPSQQQHGVVNTGEGASNSQGGVPPSYAEVIAGDHKIQSQN